MVHLTGSMHGIIRSSCNSLDCCSRLFALDVRVMSVFIDFALIAVEYFGPTMSWYLSINYSFIAIVVEVACIIF